MDLARSSRREKGPGKFCVQRPHAQWSLLPQSVLQTAVRARASKVVACKGEFLAGLVMGALVMPR
jgi:hypothetical protein